jgi:flagellar motor protein MotB
VEDSYYQHEDEIEFNFWPSFADLMLTLVLILVAVIYVYITFQALQTVNLSTIRINQEQVVRGIASALGDEEIEEDGNIYRIGESITITNDLQTQKITFSDKVLFPPDNFELNSDGKKMLRKVRDVIAPILQEQIREIQIHGHADTEVSMKHNSNLHLAAWRAISVFNFLRNDPENGEGKVNISPYEHMMSATTFGEFKPVTRSEDEKYSKNKLDEANNSFEKRSANRRIELMLFYKR